MGLFDFITGGSEGQLKRHTKRAKNLNAQAEDREASLHWLAEDGSEQAILGLLGRFNVTYEHQMKDLNEKQLVFDLLDELGEKICEPVKVWARTAPQFARPLQLVQKFQGETETVSFLLEMLSGENDPFKPEKKRQILIRLAEYTDERIFPAVEPPPPPALPVPKSIKPDLPDVEVPVSMMISDVTPADAVTSVVTDTAPVMEPVAASPLSTSTSPPVSSESPARRISAPPAAVFPAPTDTTTCPPRPDDSDAPLPTYTPPEWPAWAIADEKESEPLTPLLPAPGVDTTTLPLDVAADAPLEIVMAPPLPPPAAPAVRTQSPPPPPVALVPAPDVTVTLPPAWFAAVAWPAPI